MKRIFAVGFIGVLVLTGCCADQEAREQKIRGAALAGPLAIRSEMAEHIRVIHHFMMPQDKYGRRTPCWFIQVFFPYESMWTGGGGEWEQLKVYDNLLRFNMGLGYSKAAYEGVRDSDSVLLHDDIQDNSKTMVKWRKLIHNSFTSVETVNRDPARESLCVNRK
jgi:hypothetical protein